MMQGMDIKSIKKHPSLIPLYAVLAAGCTAAILYTGRLALKSPDVSWNLKVNSEPWNEYKDKRYQLFDPAKGKRELGHLEQPRSLWD